MFVYIIDRDGELDVFAGLRDAQEASEITGLPFVEQVVFESTNKVYSDQTREFLNCLAESGEDL